MTALEHLRYERNKLLLECDWTQGIDSPLSDSKKIEWATYRQQLRDITKTASPKVITKLGYADVLDPSSVTFPTKPS
tara:strand:+ start:1561 stop:1791 length:231 start_codon:yes stop_codon:yes gene_type:complete